MQSIATIIPIVAFGLVFETHLLCGLNILKFAFEVLHCIDELKVLDSCRYSGRRGCFAFVFTPGLEVEAKACLLYRISPLWYALPLAVQPFYK